MKTIFQVCFLCNFKEIMMGNPVIATEQKLIEISRQGNGYMIRSLCLECHCINNIYSDVIPEIYDKGGDEDDKRTNFNNGS